MKRKAPRNRTLCCDYEEFIEFSTQLLHLNNTANISDIQNRVMLGDIFETVSHLPKSFVDLLILDPPYNRSKNYHGYLFKQKELEDYQQWFHEIIELLKPVLKKQATVYVCADWKTSALILPVLKSHFYVRNRITWEREKGRGAKKNWKNNTEDIWFCTSSKTYNFDVEAVKLKRKVIASYTVNGKPKDWQKEDTGNYRLTHPSNIWTDITVPFWSMPENTEHPTQKPEKLIAKLILASSNPGDMVFDPFLGSGTTAVAAKKLGRQFCGIELNREYCCWALKRLDLAEQNRAIQGYIDGIFWERNTFDENIRNKKKREK